MDEEQTLEKKAREIALKFKENVLEYKIDLKKMIQHFGSQFNLLQANELRVLLSQQDQYYNELLDNPQGQKLTNKIICYILFAVNNPDFDKNCSQVSYTDISNFINFQNTTSPIWSGFSKFRPDELKILQQISSQIHGKQQNTYQSLLNSLGINGSTLNKQSIRHLIKKNTRNTSEEQITSIFTKLDENGDGSVDIYEFEKNLTEIAQQTQERIQKFQVYIEKIILSILKQYGRITPQIVQQQFKELANSQNKVEIKNFIQFVSKLDIYRSMDVLEIENFFYLMDQDGDGTMNFSEFADMISSKVEQLNKSKKIIFRKIIDTVISNGLYLKQFIQDGFYKVLKTNESSSLITSLDLYNFMIDIVQDISVKKIEIDDIMNNYNVLSVDSFLDEIENFYVSTIQREKLIYKILYEIIQNLNEGVMEQLINGDQEKLLNYEEFEKLCAGLVEDCQTSAQKLYFHLQQNYFGITTTKNLMTELEKFYSTNFYQFQEAQQIICQLVEIIFIKQYVLEDLFDQFDLNQDKELSFIEFSMLLQQVKFDLTQEQSQIVFNWFDLNLDGTIQRDEFVQSIKHYFSKIIEPNQNTYEISYILAKNIGELQDQNQFFNIFQSYDRNHDNSLEFLEFGSLIRDLYPKANEKDMTTIFQLITNSQDVNNSCLTFEQFVQGSLNLTQLIRARYNVVLESPIQRTIYPNKRQIRDWDQTGYDQTEFFIDNITDLEEYSESIQKKYKQI